MRSSPSWLAVANWETRRVVGRGDYLFSVLLMPILIVGVGFFIGWMKERAASKPARVAAVLVDEAGAASGWAPRPAERVEWVAANDPSRAALTAQVDARKLDGAVFLPSHLAAADSVDLIVRRSRPEWRDRVIQALSEESRAARAEQFGLDSTALASLDAPLGAREVVTSRSGRTSKPDRITAMITLVLTITTIFTCGAYLGVGITGEKQSRATEVILSAITAQAWIDGKIVAYVLAGLIQVVLWAGAGVALALFSGFPISAHLDPVATLLLLLLFLVALVLYVSLYALVYATVKDLQSTSKLQAYLFFMPLVPLFFVEVVMSRPDAAWIVALSHVPFFSPSLLPMRVALGAAAAWELPVAVLVASVTAWFLRGAAGHAMRIGMLMYGKEVSLPELIRWSREE